VTIRTKFALAVGVPLLIVYVATTAVLVSHVRKRSLAHLERAVTDYTGLVAALVDERLEHGAAPGDVLQKLRLGPAAAEGATLAVVSADGTLLAISGTTAPVTFNLRRYAAEAGRSDVDSLLTRAAAGERGVTTIPGFGATETRWVGFAPLRSRAGAVLASAPASIVLAFENDQLRIGIGILTAGLLAILAALLLLSAAITHPVRRLAAAVARLGTGDLAARVQGVDSRDEIGQLAAGFNRMVVDLEASVEARSREAAARDAMERELKLAREIQTALLPEKLPSSDAYALAARHLAARQVAGDFFDAYVDRSGKVVFLLADVSGKGAAAAIFMAHSQLVVRQALEEEPTLAEAVKRASDALRAEEAGNMYLTLFAGRLDPVGGALTYVNAGHPRPFRLDAGGRATPFGEVTGGVVGLIDGFTFDEKSERLGAGERLVVFSDGVPDATRTSGEPLADDGIVEILQNAPLDATPAVLAERLTKGVDVLQRGHLVDDVTVLVVARSARDAGASPCDDPQGVTAARRASGGGGRESVRGTEVARHMGQHAD
jgi:sigma-B regulation protein RsbU (phosphoserine phosphatase)